MALLHTLTDNFNDNSRDVTKWTQFANNSTVSETGAMLQVTTTTTAGYAGFTSLNSFDLTGSYGLVQLVAPGNTALTAYEVYPISLSDASGNNKLEIAISGGNLISIKKVATVQTNVNTRTFNSAIHKWFRVKHSSTTGKIYWQYSANGQLWHNLAVDTTPITITALYMGITAGTYSNMASGTTAQFDNFNVPNTITRVTTTQGTDDGHEVISTGVNATNLQGTTTAARIDGLNHVGLRFPGLAIEQGAGVKSAILKFPQLFNYTGTGNLDQVTLYGEANGNAPVFGTSSYNLNYRGRTDNRLEGSTLGATATQWTTNGVDVGKIVQEIVNRRDWTLGNAMALLFIGSGTGGNFIQPYFWDYTSGLFAATLDITLMDGTAISFPSANSIDSSVGTQTWTNVSNVYVDDASSAASSWPFGGDSSYILNLTGFNLDIPSTAKINGIALRIEKSGFRAMDTLVYLRTGGSNVTPNMIDDYTWSSATNIIYGGPEWKWGRNWTPAELNDSTFGVQLRYNNTSGGGDVSVENVSITVYYSNTSNGLYNQVQSFNTRTTSSAIGGGNFASGAGNLGVIEAITNNTDSTKSITRLTWMQRAGYNEGIGGDPKTGEGGYTIDNTGIGYTLKAYSSLSNAQNQTSPLGTYNGRNKSRYGTLHDWKLSTPISVASGAGIWFRWNWNTDNDAGAHPLAGYLTGTTWSSDDDANQITYVMSTSSSSGPSVSRSMFYQLYENEVLIPDESAFPEGDSDMTATGYTWSYGEGDMEGDSEMTASGYLMGYGEADFEGDSSMIADQIAFEGEGVMVADGTVNPLTIVKSYMYKIYDTEWNFLGIWKDVVSDFGYSQEINSAGSAISITLARNSDSLNPVYDVISDDSSDPLITDGNDEIAAESTTLNSIGPGTTVDLNLNVRIYEFNSDEQPIEGDLVFTGYISMYTSQYGSTENTVVSVFSYGADLDNYVLTNNDATRVPYYSTDPGMLLRNAYDKFNADLGIVTYHHNDTALDFTGTAGQHAISAADFNLGLTNANIFTFACWIRPDTLPTQANRMNIWGSNNVASTFQLEVGGSVGGDSGTVLAYVNTTEVAKTANAQIAAGNWYHIVYVKNGTGAGASEIWINGVSVSTPVDIASTYVDSTATHYIGGRTDTSQKFNGIIDDVTVWDSALNGTQIAALYNTNTRVASPKLWYKMDENNGTLVANSGSKTGANMTLAGGTWTDTIPPPMDAAITQENTIENTGTIVSYTYNANTMLEVTKKALELAPTHWYFYADLATNLLHFHPRPLVPAHYFYLGKHVFGLSLEKNMEGIVNDIIFTGGVPENLVSDNFLMPTGSDIINHLPETGSTWIKHGTTVANQTLLASSAGRLYKSGSGEMFMYNNVPMVNTDFDVSADIYIASNANEIGLLGGLAAAADVGILGQISSSNLSLYSRTAGTWTQLGSSVAVSPTVGQTYKMRLTRVGQNITLYWNNAAAIEVTSSASQSAGVNVYTGIRASTASTSTTGYHLDNFRAKLTDVTLGPRVYKRYEDTTSQTTYRRGLKRIQDNRVTLESSADIIVESEIDQNKEPRYRSQISISGSTYDIRSIKLGDLVGFRNFGNFVDTVTMQVVRIDYMGESVTLQLDTLLPSVPKRLEDIKRNLAQAEVANNPDTPDS